MIVSDILQNVSFLKAVLIYNDAGGKKHRDVKMDYFDESSCLFSMDININFLLPEKNSPVEINLFAENGVYKAISKFIDVQKSANKAVFEIITPKSWDYIQRRQHLRKKIQLPVKILYDDGFEINSTTDNFSAGGFAAFYKGHVSSIYQKIEAKVCIKFPEGIMGLDENTLCVKAKCVRVQENIPGHFGEKLIAYTFTSVDKSIIEALRRFVSMSKE